MLTSGLVWRALSRSGEKLTGVSLEDKRHLIVANAGESLEECHTCGRHALWLPRDVSRAPGPSYSEMRSATKSAMQGRIF